MKPIIRASLAAVCLAILTGAFEVRTPGIAWAQNSMSKMLTLLTCTSYPACLSINNTGKGSAMVGASGGNSGVIGHTSKTVVNDPGDANSIGGIAGFDTSAVPSQRSHSFTAALFGRSRNGEGTLSVSDRWQGIVGVTFNPGSITQLGTNGVVGLDSSTDNSGFNDGVEGLSNSGTGGVFVTLNPSRQTQFGSIGVLGIDGSSDGGLQNVGVWGASSGVAVVADGFAPAQAHGAAQYPAILARCQGGGPAIIAASGSHQPADDIMSLDCAGNLVIKGSLTTHSSPAIATRTASGSYVTTYGSREETPTIEDVGEAQLYFGAASVRIDPQFAAMMDSHTPYMVLLTPEGDSRGLYVVEKQNYGFVVRENQGGRSSVRFAYRIVARPLDASSSIHPAAASNPSNSKPAFFQALERRTLRAVAPLLRHP